MSVTCTYITFINVDILKIPSFVFSHLSQCSTIRISSTKTSSVEIDAWFGLQLRALYIQRSNSLRVLTGNMFQHLTSLEHLDLLENHISVITSSEVWNDLSSLIFLRLTGNKITVLKANMFSNLLSLQSLYLGENLITQVEKDSFSGLFNLTIVVLGDNEISSIEFGAFQGLRSLNRLYLGENDITAIASGAWNGLNDNLTYLDLSQNCLTHLYQNMFSQLSGLQELKLPFNKIEAIDTDALSGLKSIQTLWLIDNKLETLEFQTFNTTDFNDTGGHPGNAAFTLTVTKKYTKGKIQK